MLLTVIRSTVYILFKTIMNDFITIIKSTEAKKCPIGLIDYHIICTMML